MTNNDEAPQASLVFPGAMLSGGVGIVLKLWQDGSVTWAEHKPQDAEDARAS